MNKIRNSQVAGQVPSAAQMEPGDIGVNNADGTIYILRSNSSGTSVIQLSGLTSFNKRTGDIVLNSGDVTSALGFTPVNPAAAVLTGIPTAPTATPGANTTQLATTAFVATAISNIALPVSATTLQALTDVSVVDGAAIDGQVLSYSASKVAWRAIPLAKVATSGLYSDLSGTPAQLVNTFNTRTGNVTLTSSDVTTALGFTPTNNNGGVIIGTQFRASEAGTGAANTEFTAGYTFTNDGYHDSGMYSPSDGIIKFYANAVDVLDLTNTAITLNLPTTIGSTLAITGVATAPTPTSGDSSTKIATTAFVTSAINAAATGVTSFNTRTGAVTLAAVDLSNAGGALLSSPTFSGVPAAPTPVVGDNSTRIATTAFVNSSITTAATAASPIRMTGNFRYSAAQTLVASQAGGIVYLTGGTAFTITLPTAASVNNYSGFIFSNVSSVQVTIATVGSDAIEATATGSNTSGGPGQASVVLQPGDNFFILSDGANFWHRAFWSNMISPTFYGTPTAPTATTFDNSTTLANTAFVKASGFHFPNTSGVAITAAATLTIAQLNGWFQFQNNVQVTLPPIATAQIGTTYTFLGGSTGGTIKGNASEGIMPVGGTVTNTITVAVGEALTLAVDGNSLWYVVMDGVGSSSLTGYAPINNPTFTGRVYFPEGTAALPSITFVNDGAIDTGFWHISDGVFGVTCNGVEQARFATGVGTTFATPVFGPTASAGTNTTQLATTAFVAAAVTSGAGVTTFNTRSGAITLTSSDVTNALTYAPVSPATLAASKYYDMSGGAAGAITSSQLLAQIVTGRTVTFPNNFANSQGYAAIAPTASATFTIAVNGTTFGTMVFAAGSKTSTFTTVSGTGFTLSPGQVITITAPATADATLSTVSCALLGIAT
jgi:hypothetical protein